jgi:4-hydroxy-2-oxoheptanedioate aldolase
LKNLRTALDSGDVVCGPGIFSGHTGMVELAGYLGFDFVFLDTEQTPIGPFGTELERLIQVAEASDVTPTVRLAELSAAMMNKALNLGARAVWVPHVESADDAAAVVRYGRYAPRGDRGAAPIVRSARYGLVDFDTYREQQDGEVLLIAIVESVAGIDNIDAIAGTPGLDAVCFGPFDLGISMGLSQRDFYGGGAAAWVHPQLEDAGRRCVDACRRQGVYAVTAAWSVESAQRWRSMGYQMFLYGLDYAIIARAFQGLRDDVDQIKATATPA